MITPDLHPDISLQATRRNFPRSQTWHTRTRPSVPDLRRAGVAAQIDIAQGQRPVQTLQASVHALPEEPLRFQRRLSKRDRRSSKDLRATIGFNNMQSSIGKPRSQPPCDGHISSCDDDLSNIQKEKKMLPSEISSTANSSTRNGLNSSKNCDGRIEMGKFRSEESVTPPMAPRLRAVKEGQTPRGQTPRRPVTISQIAGERELDQNTPRNQKTTLSQLSPPLTQPPKTTNETTPQEVSRSGPPNMQPLESEGLSRSNKTREARPSVSDLRKLFDKCSAAVERPGLKMISKYRRDSRNASLKPLWEKWKDADSRQQEKAGLEEKQTSPQQLVQSQEGRCPTQHQAIRTVALSPHQEEIPKPVHNAIINGQCMPGNQSRTYSMRKTMPQYHQSPLKSSAGSHKRPSRNLELDHGLQTWSQQSATWEEVRTDSQTEALELMKKTHANDGEGPPRRRKIHVSFGAKAGSWLLTKTVGLGGGRGRHSSGCSTKETQPQQSKGLPKHGIADSYSCYKNELAIDGVSDLKRS